MVRAPGQGQVMTSSIDQVLTRSGWRRLWFWVKRILLALLALLLLGLVIAAILEAIARNRATGDYPPPGKLVDVGGRKMHIDCRGSGSPTVVLEAGLSTGGSVDWDYAAPTQWRFSTGIFAIFAGSWLVYRNRLGYNAMEHAVLAVYCQILVMAALLVNLLRSVPFIILLVAIIPLTRFIVGTSIGTIAAIVPLTVGCIPFIARLVEGALMEVPDGLLEAAKAMGAKPLQIIAKVLLPEALPGILNSVIITLVTLVNYSAMAGAIGGGGLGGVGIR